MFFSNKKDTTEYGVILEVGSGSIAGAIVSSNPKTKYPVVLYATREFLPLKQTDITEDINKRLITAFMTTAMDIETKVAQHIPRRSKLGSVYVNFTAPWSHTRGNTHTYNSDKPVLITDKLLKTIKNSTTKKLTAQSESALSSKKSNFTLIDRTITGHTANYYPIENPVGKTVTTLTTTETISAVENDIYIPVEEIVNKLFSNTKIKFSTSSLVQQHLLQSLVDTPSTFATVHLTYEAIELALYRDNELVTAFTADIGINTIARNIAKTSKLPHEQVFAFLTGDTADNYQETTLKKIKKAFDSKVLGPLADFFAETQSSELLPRDFYLISTIVPSPAIISMITEALKESSNTRFILHNLYTPMVHNTIDASLGSNDLGICTMAYFFHNSVMNY